MSETRYVVRESPRYPGQGWWEVYDTVKPSLPAFVSGRAIYAGHDKTRAQADADWLNDLAGPRNEVLDALLYGGAPEVPADSVDAEGRVVMHEVDPEDDDE